MRRFRFERGHVAPVRPRPPRGGRPRRRHSGLCRRHSRTQNPTSGLASPTAASAATTLQTHSGRRRIGQENQRRRQVVTDV